MAFINERVPEEQKSKFDINIFHKPIWPWLEMINFSRWVVDRERDVFMITLGGGGPWEGGDAPLPPKYLALSWKGEVVKFEARYRGEGSGRIGEPFTLYIEVSALQIPPALEGRRDEVLQLIHEALEVAGGSTFDRDGISAIHISFK